jgi:hypothetical protein
MGQGTGSDEGGGGGQFMGHTDRGEEGRLSFQDEEDYGRQPRVLKVRDTSFFFSCCFIVCHF